MKNIKEIFSFKKISSKNYVIVLIVSVLVIALTLYVRSFYLSYELYKTNNSVFIDKSVNQMNTEDFDFALTEVSEAILYVSYTGSSELYDIEKRLYREMEKKDLISKVIYWNVTDFKGNDEYLKMLKEHFPEVKDEITTSPLLIYIKDGKAVEAISSKLKTIDYIAFDKLIEKYEIE